MCTTLIKKYNIPGPRYTSYPTVPYWDLNVFNTTHWLHSLKKSFIETNNSQGISLYIHLPFCESLCTFCGCHKRITKRHEVEEHYISYLLKEWNMYCNFLEDKPIIKEIHLGGGTPTFFSAKNLEYLIKNILKKANVHAEHEFSFEGHPNNTSRYHLETLYNIGFRRVSFGVQDYSTKVQKAINRKQPFHNVAKVTLWAKEIGYTSISHDLVFGLPFQELENVIDTIEKTNSLNPDRLSFYSYAHVPWIKGNGQRGFKDEDVPKDEAKRELYEKGKELLAKKGYKEIGMDHFALPTDSMYESLKNKELHRNFMGYTSSKTQVMIGLGASSISDSWYSFAQNEKEIEEYYNLLDKNEFPILKGHLLTNKDLTIRQHILNIMCQFETILDDNLSSKEVNLILEHLKELENDGLVIISDNKILVTEKGKPFVRNICMAFDLKLIENKPETQVFSLTI